MVKTPIFWVLLVMFIFANAAGTMMVSATSPIAQTQIGLSAMDAALCVSLMTLFNMFGRLSFGVIYDKLKGWNSLILVLILNGISMLMLTVAHSFAYFVACIALVGFSFGGLLVVFAPMVKTIFGSKYYNRNYGLIFIGYGIGARFDGISCLRRTRPNTLTRLFDNGMALFFFISSKISAGESHSPSSFSLAGRK